MTRTAVFDLDGTLAVGQTPFEGASAAIETAREAGYEVLVFTNRSTVTPGEVVETLEKVGITLDPRQVLTAPQIASESMAEEGHRPFVIGSDALYDALATTGVATGSPDADSVLVGLPERLTPDDLAGAARLLETGVPLYATNPDAVVPGPDGPRPGTGTVLGAIREMVDCDPKILGKPERPAQKALADRITPSQSVLVGDNPRTDVALGRAIGTTTVLVGSDAAASEPDFVLDDVRDLSEALDH